MESKTPPAIICAENSALLHLLHVVATPPSSNPVKGSSHRKGYTISLEDERSLAGTLAFLSYVREDPEHIPAICVQEGSSSLSVLLAVNKANVDSGDHVSQEIKAEFEKIFEILSRVLDEDRSVIERKIFAAIISTCEDRIRYRLRFIPSSRNPGRPSFKAVLQETVSALTRLDQKRVENLVPIATLFVRRSKEVIKLIDSWTKYQTLTRLGDLVEGIYQLRQVGELDNLINAISNQLMDPSSRRSICNIIKKVARYREAARFLYRIAKRLPQTRSMSVIIVKLPGTAFERPLVDEYKPNLFSTIFRVNVSHAKQLDRICAFLKTTQKDANDQFSQRTKRTLREAKVHAEMQILFYLNQKSPKFPPRIICSSKDACFLCNLFILMDGKMHTPRCHGRVYPGWRLPLFPELSDTEQRFNQTLQMYIGGSLSSLLRTRKKILYPEPNESTLLTLPVSMSTLRSLVVSEAVSDKAVPLPPQITQSPDSRVSLPSATAMPAEEVMTSGGNTLSSHERPSSTSSAHQGGELIQGRMISGSLEIGGISKFHTAGHLKIILEYDVGSAGGPRNLTYNIKWLTEEEAELLHKRQSVAIIDGELLKEEITCEADEHNAVYVTGKGSVLQIVLSSSGGVN